MDPATWFDDLPVLGRQSPSQAAARLKEMGETDAAAVLELGPTRGPAFGMLGWWPFQDKPWQHTAHAFGYLAPAASMGEPLALVAAGMIPKERMLEKGARLKITLDRLRVAAYPGGGTHRILFDFYAQNQVPGTVEHLHFNITCRVREGEQAAVLGYPIFVGLNVGAEGMAFKCFTVNVKNDEDEALLGFLDSDVFKGGLKLAQTMQPAIAPLSGMALALTRTLAGRHQNVPVQEFYLGLDFSDIPTRARLAEGSYVAVQISETMETVWNWQDWVYQPGSGQVVKKENERELIPYNYLVFGVSQYAGD
jgi:hypothetical protein